MPSGAPGAVPRLLAPAGGEGQSETGHVATLLMTGARAAAVREVLTAVLGRRLPRTPRGTYLVLHGALDPAAHRAAEAVPVVRRTFEDPADPAELADRAEPGEKAELAGPAGPAELAGREELAGPAGPAELAGREELAGPAGAAGACRPFRRVDMIVDDPLLDWVRIFTVRATTHDAHHHRLVQRLVTSCDGLVLVTDGRFPYQSAELEVLSLASRAKPVFLAVACADDRWPAVAQANRSVLASQFPHLVAQPWFLLSQTRSAVPDLRHAVHAWARRSAS